MSILCVLDLENICKVCDFPFIVQGSTSMLGLELMNGLVKPEEVGVQ